MCVGFIFSLWRLFLSKGFAVDVFSELFVVADFVRVVFPPCAHMGLNQRPFRFRVFFTLAFDCFWSGENTKPIHTKSRVSIRTRLHFRKRQNRVLTSIANGRPEKRSGQ